jgi:uncharacterized protein YndB with AHSA1/START domain
MPYTYTLTTVIPATPEEIYQAWLDSVAHSEMTGGDANISDEIGAEFSAWDEYIKGRNLELVPGERIVQSWRTDEYGDEHADSTVTITFEEMGDGTLLTLVHSNVPDDQKDYEEGGWESNYFEPMKVYFANLERASAEAAPPDVAPEGVGEMPSPAPAEKPAKKPARTPASKPASKPTGKSTTAKPRAKVARAKKKAKRASAPKPKRKTAKPSTKKSAKRLAKRPAKRAAKRPQKRKARKASRRPRAHR